MIRERAHAIASGPYKCIYCLSSNNVFSRREHPIPESLGNDDLLLPQGYVCDLCNQYFGSKIEREILQSAPIGPERVFQAIKTKKGRYARVSDGSLSLRGTGFWDHAILQPSNPHPGLFQLSSGRIAVNPKWAPPDTIARFLIKMGLGLLVIAEDADPYSSTFDRARNCARYGKFASDWDFALGLYPDRANLIRSISSDHIGSLETRQIYQYGLGIMESSDVIFFFAYATSCFAVNLSRPSILDYILEFNRLNSFSLESRYRIFRRPPLSSE